MSEYIVSARKYRPSTFQSVVGQKALVQTLKNAIRTGKLAHAYLFCGPRGVGKTTCARIFAKTINCQHLTDDGEACNECESCRSFNEQRSLNIHELDAASNNGVDNIRELIEQVQIPPQIGRYKVFIIDEVHMLSTAAFNAFLKTLEEPPSHAIFIMATTEKQKILPTILSRCQTYDFQRISIQDIADQLAYIAAQENIAYEPQALQIIARKADGGMRDALSMFDQIVSFTQGNVTYQAVVDNLGILDYELFFRLTDAALGQNVPAALMLLDQALRRGHDAQIFIGGWAAHLRDVMVARDAATLSLVEAGPELAMRYQQQAAQCPVPFLYAALQIANECDFNYRNSRNKRLSVEIAIVRICNLLAPTPAPAATGPTQPRPTPQPAPQPAPTVATAGPRPPQPTPAPSTATAQARPTQQTPRPQPQPTPAMPPQGRFAPRTSTTGGTGGGRTASMRSVATPASAAAATTAAQPLEEMNEPVEPEALRRTWRTYTTTIPTEKLLVTTMVGCLPQQVADTQYKVTLMSQEQMDRLGQHLPEVVRYLQSELHNTHITIRLELAAADDVRPFTPREKLNVMRKANPAVDTLIDTFGLELA